jgi:uncharacterized protein (TIGR03083 family)
VDLDRQLTAIEDAKDRLVDAASRPDVAVPSCPGWDMADLVWHVGVVGDLWRHTIEGSLGAPVAFRPGERPERDELATWLDDRLQRMVVTVGGADPAAPVRTWVETVPASFVQRRLTHELTMHAWDADRALERAQPIPLDLAEDGIDELLSSLAFFGVPVPGRLAAGEGIHLHCTDDDLPEGGGEWVVRGPGGSWEVERRHAKETFAARGAASDVLLALWGRAPIEGLSTFGDQALLDEVVAGLRERTGGGERG